MTTNEKRFVNARCYNIIHTLNTVSVVLYIFSTKHQVMLVDPSTTAKSNAVTTFYIAFMPIDPFLDNLPGHSANLPCWKHWKLFYTQDGLKHYVMEINPNTGVRHSAVYKRGEPGFDNKQKLFDVVFPFNLLRFKLYNAFYNDKYDIATSNCKHFVLRVVKFYLDKFFQTENKTMLADEILALGYTAMNMCFLQLLCASSSSSTGSVAFAGYIWSHLLLLSSSTKFVQPKSLEEEEMKEVEASLPPWPPELERSGYRTPEHIRVALRMGFPIPKSDTSHRRPY
ncbi:hypothetical protein BDB00DRAFT_797829, partial [Zychaea mexicana]|uniref:uncharacterized protein n=1 Tax=Zychaea mexicana TaxID=64656 RepID=UPI0022FE3630